jgi:quercetin dioxygenase-like cupin family protein
MRVYRVSEEQEFSPERHVGKVLGTFAGGDVSVACLEPGQVSPHHAHPGATEVYFCIRGGGEMRTPEGTVSVSPGDVIVHEKGEPHAYANGEARTLLFRVRYGEDLAARVVE